MSRFIRRVSLWFGYSRRERRASFILLLIIILTILTKIIIPERKTEVESIFPSTIYRYPPLKKPMDLSPGTSVAFDFDPNLALPDSLFLVGLSRKQVKTLMNYRERGGRFRKPEDIYNVYGMDSTLAKHLIPYIIIREKEKQLHVSHSADTSHRFKIRKRVVEKTDLNLADSAGLEKLPGIGPVFSARIIRYRDLLGGFYSIEQVREVYGLSDSTFNLISGRIIADSSEIKMIDVNKASFRELAKHPYFDRYDVQAILKFKAVKGRIDSIDELVLNKILTPLKATRIKPYLVFRKQE